jgi:replicative DNA helicase
MPKEGTEEFFKWQTEIDSVHGIAEIIIGKQRHGPTGTIKLQFEDSLTRFSNLADTAAMPEPYG